MARLASRRRSQGRLCRLSRRRRRRLRALARRTRPATVQRDGLWLVPEPEPEFIEVGREIYETVLAHVRATQLLARDADQLMHELHRLEAAIVGDDASAVAAYDAVLARWVEATKPARAADHLIFRLEELAAAIEAGEARAVAAALGRLGVDYGKGAGRIQVRRAAHKKHKEDGAKKRTDKTKPGGGEDAIIAALMKLNGGRLPPRLKRGTAGQVARDLGYRSDYVSQVKTERRKKES